MNTPLPTNSDEWEAKIKQDALEKPFGNIAKRYPSRSSTETMRLE